MYEHTHTYIYIHIIDRYIYIYIYTSYMYPMTYPSICNGYQPTILEPRKGGAGAAPAEGGFWDDGLMVRFGRGVLQNGGLTIGKQ